MSKTDETLYNTIIEILKKEPKTRDDDTLLIFKCLLKFGIAKNKDNKLIIDLLKYDEIPSFESIRRIRQKIQNEDNLYPSSEITQNKREKAEIEFKTKYRKKTQDVNSAHNSHLMW